MLTLTRTLLTPVLIAIAVAAVVAFVVVVVVRGSGSAAAPAAPAPSGRPTPAASVSHSSSSPAPSVRWSSVVPSLACGGVGVIVDHRVTGDLNGDGRPDAVIAAHCDAGAGSPPSVVEVFLDDAGHATPLGEVVAAGDDLLVRRLSVKSGVIALEAEGYSPGTPRCCPDRTVNQTWLVRTTAGQARLVHQH